MRSRLHLRRAQEAICRLRKEVFKPNAVHPGPDASGDERVRKWLPGSNVSPELARCIRLLVAVSGEDAEMVGLSFDRYFQKPVDPESLLKLLGELAVAHK